MEKISRKGFLKIAAAAAMSGVTAAGLAACNAASGSSGASSAAGIYTPGTYTATAKGMSEITATVTFDANTITKVELDLSGETESIGGAAKDKLIEQIMNAQTSQIDGVTGATVTSKAVQNAVADCIQQASGGAINLHSSPPRKPPLPPTGWVRHRRSPRAISSRPWTARFWWWRRFFR